MLALLSETTSDPHGFSSQRTSNSESVTMPWGYHNILSHCWLTLNPPRLNLFLENITYLCIVFLITDMLLVVEIQQSSSHGMMTSSNGNIFRVTGPLCGEFTRPVTGVVRKSLKNLEFFFSARYHVIVNVVNSMIPRFNFLNISTPWKMFDRPPFDVHHQSVIETSLLEQMLTCQQSDTE